MTSPIDPLQGLIEAESRQAGASEAARARVRAGLEARLAAGAPPPVPDGPAQLAAGPGGAGWLAVVLGGTSAVAIAVATALGGLGGSSGGGEARAGAGVEATAEVSAVERDADPAAPKEALTEIREGVDAEAELRSVLEGGDGAVEARDEDGPPGPEQEDSPGAREPRARAPRSVAKGATAPEAPVEEDTGLAAEYRLVQRLWSSLNAGDAAAALRLVESHARRFPDGQLVQEREAARVLALCAAGRSSEAARRSVSFVARFPGSSHRARIERGCAP